MRPERRSLAVVLIAVVGVVAPTLPALATGPSTTPGRPLVSSQQLMSPGLPSLEDLERRWPEFQDLLSRTGAPGSYANNDGQIVVVVPGSVSSASIALDAAALGIPVLVETSDIKPSEAIRIRKLVAEVDWEPQKFGVGLPIALFDASKGHFEIYSDAPPELFSSIIDQFPGKVVYANRALRLMTRWNDVEPHWGGAKVALPGESYRCTSGFSVRNEAENPRMVIAGHCFEPGETVDSPGGTTFGNVKPRIDWPSVDAALVGGSGITHGPSIYVGDNSGTRADVSDATDPAGGILRYCFSGATEYENCGLWLVNSDESHDFYGVGRVEHFMRYRGAPGNGACPGDSGAPFYRELSNTVGIRGIVIGGGTGPDVRLDPPPNDPCEDQDQTEVLVMKWSLIRDTYSVTIKTI